MPGFWNSSYPENLELYLEQETLHLEQETVAF